MLFYKDCFVLNLWNKEEGAIFFFISLVNSIPFIGISKEKITKLEPYKHPFYDFLNKHLIGSEISEITINRFDKVLKISFSNDFPVGKLPKVDVVLELITNKSNAIALVDNIIKTSYKEIIPDDPLKRKILPALEYQYPEKSTKKLEPKEITFEILSELGIEKALSEKTFGIPKNVIEEVKDWTPQKVIQWINADFENLNSKVLNNELILSLNFDKSSILENIYSVGINKIIEINEEKKKRELELQRKKKIAYLEKKLENVRKDYEKNLRWKDIHSKAQNILNNLDKIEIINNQYVFNDKIIGNLSKTPGKLANDLFEKSKKMKSALLKIEKMINSLESQIQRVKAENTDNSRVEKSTKEKSHKEKDRPKDYIKIDFDDYTIALVGKNANSNINLLKISNPNDWWFHTRNYPGSYVILKTTKKELSQVDIKKAAQICAHFSKAKREKEVEVVFTQVKYLTKPKGKKNGTIFYRNEKTIFVSPEQEENF
ncbi:putative component of the ribosome quality control (RQC) complex [Thermodesulfobium acidiphilum]|uniref:Putative component of the ribosome quality control (RQC) complex n=1 Tax=Thermodesulfobium acidiphilum TaxID=1794699 RepID=A0A2R4W024_THEAF|nr:NFACT RNA binding domain-containing protein [Thermodesulfobium acidiphilum]AWB10112.1 putative component of the ribosome quality control (RQC) complex [Thermodesulfobium acidiphilum]